MKVSAYITFATMSVFGGILVYAYFNEWIIIKNPWELYNTRDSIYIKIDRTLIKLFFWRHNQWETETFSCVFPENIQEQGVIIVQSWFHEANQTGFIKNNSSVETVLFDQRQGCLYISLNAVPFDYNQSTQETLYILESLLKTIRFTLSQNIQSIHILIHQKIYTHPHVDCTQPFPIMGLGIIKQ